MGALNLKPQPPLGLDISDLSLKLVQLKKSGRKIKLQALSRIAVPEGYIEAGIIKKKDKVAELIKKMQAETILGKITSNKVVACLPETKTFIKLINVTKASLPIANKNNKTDKKKTGTNFRDNLIDELEKQIPYRLSEVNYDWQTIGSKAGVAQVLIGVISKRVADDYYDLLTTAGLTPIALEIEAVAIVRSLINHYKKSASVTFIVDIGAKRSSLIAFANKTILFTVSLPISGQQITGRIAKKLNLAPDKAEAAKIVCGLNEKLASGVVVQVIDEKIRDLRHKIKKAVDYSINNYPQFGEVKRIYLCGGGANIKGLDKRLSAKLNIPTKAGNVFTNINISLRQENKYLNEEFATLKKIAHDHKIKQNFSLNFTTAVGLALRGVYDNKL